MTDEERFEQLEDLYHILQRKIDESEGFKKEWFTQMLKQLPDALETLEHSRRNLRAMIQRLPSVSTTEPTSDLTEEQRDHLWKAILEDDKEVLKRIPRFSSIHEMIDAFDSRER